MGMDAILNAIEEKFKLGYSSYQIEVNFGYLGDEDNEGYYLSKLNGWGSTPITEILAREKEVEDKILIKELDRLDIVYCL